jgi:hypothetical protein
LSPPARRSSDTTIAPACRILCCVHYARATFSLDCHFSVPRRRRLIQLALVSERNSFSLFFSKCLGLSRAVRSSDGTSFCCCCWLQTLVRIRLLMAVCLPHFMDRGGGESARYDVVRRPRYAAAAAARADVIPRVRWGIYMAFCFVASLDAQFLLSLFGSRDGNWTWIFLPGGRLKV